MSFFLDFVFAFAIIVDDDIMKFTGVQYGHSRNTKSAEI